jgi:hypothetical protein
MPRSTKPAATTISLIVQHVHISWTKAARGGGLAEQRSQIPKAFSIPRPLPTFDKNDHYVVHRVDFGEGNEFAEPIRSHTTTPNITTPFSTTNCTIELTNGTAEILYEWRDGAPERQFFDKSGTPVPVRKRLQLHPGKWVRVEYNGRFTGYDSGNWWYEHSVINVAFAALDHLDIFLDSEPAELIRQVHHLW